MKKVCGNKQEVLAKHKTYPAIQCTRCKKIHQAQVTLFLFYKKHGAPYYKYHTFHYNGPTPKVAYTIRDDKPICNTCAGFQPGIPHPDISMEQHHYEWVDGTTNYCKVGHIRSWKKPVSRADIIAKIHSIQQELTRLKHLIR